MRVLGIETSCDETAVAIVEAPAGSTPVGRILANVVYSQLTEHRHTRLIESDFRIPSDLWCVLLIGAVVTIASASMFGSANLPLHALQVIFFSLLVSLVLLAIADINRPFQGAVHVSNYAFQRAQETMID